MEEDIIGMILNIICKCHPRSPQQHSSKTSKAGKDPESYAGVFELLDRWQGVLGQELPSQFWSWPPAFLRQGSNAPHYIHKLPINRHRAAVTRIGTKLGLIGSFK